MTRTDPHERYEELAAGHALSALEPEDEQLFLDHLAGCARCKRELAVHSATLAHLAYAPDAAEPPDSLLAAIRDRVRESGRGVTFRDVTDPRVTGPDLRASSSPAGTAALDGARRRRAAARLRRSGTWTGIAAAAALVLGLGVWNTSLQQDRDQQDAWGDRMTAAVRELRETDADTVPLEGTDGNVVAVALVRGSELSLVVDGLPVNDDGTTYVLWGQSRSGDVRPVGVFDVARGGLDVQRDMRIPVSAGKVTRFMVTREQSEQGPRFMATRQQSGQAPPIPTQPVLASGDV